LADRVVRVAIIGSQVQSAPAVSGNAKARLMSYSFAVSGTSKADAVAKVADEFEQVVAAQAVHAADKDAAVAAATAFVGLLQEPAENEVIAVSVYGSLSWQDYSDTAPTASGPATSASAHLS
jgi:hypothetical protein